MLLYSLPDNLQNKNKIRPKSQMMNGKWTMKMRSSELPDWSLRVQSTGVEVRRACLMQKHYATSRVVKIIRSMEEKYICQRSWDCCRKAITRSASMDLTISGTWDHKNKQTDRTTSAVIIITSILVAGAMKWTTLGCVCVCVATAIYYACIFKTRWRRRRRLLSKMGCFRDFRHYGRCTRRCIQDQ